MKYKVLFPRFFHLTVVLLAAFLITASPAQADSPAATVGTAFSYQGWLTDNGNSASGAYDFQFILYDAAIDGSQQGATLTLNGITVSHGIFSVQLDFGQAVFNGEARFLEIGVKSPGSGSTYTVLLPRQALTAVPYALGMPGLKVQNSTLQVAGDLEMAGNDFFMRANDRGDGGRAMVHWVNDTLVLNMENDFAGGTVVESTLQVNGNLGMGGGDFFMSADARGDGGRAMVHGENDTLVFNYQGDFPGGAVVDSTLHVNGDVRVNGGNFIDDGTALNVPDYVFEDDYNLMSLDELAAYLAREKHLPGVPSQDEIHRDGLNLSQFHMRLLEKVEELTLYTLAQQEQIDALEERLAALEQAQ